MGGSRQTRGVRGRAGGGATFRRFAAVLLCASVVPCLAAEPVKWSPLRDRFERAPEFGRFTRTELQVAHRPNRGIRTELEIDGVRRRIDLEPHNLRHEEFQILVQGPDGEVWPHPLPPVATYRGRVEGVPGSRVIGSLSDGRMQAEIHLDRGNIWHVAPLPSNKLRFAGDRADHAVYRDQDVEREPGDWSCGELHADPSATGGIAAESLEQLSVIAGVGMKVAEIAFDADREFFVANGSSVADTVTDIEAVMNLVSALYETQANITYEITTIIVRTDEPDPYSSTNNLTLLDQFKNEWNLNRRGIRRDIAHLMTGKSIDNNIIGTAEIGQLCSVCGTDAQGYGFSESRFSTNWGDRRCLTAHELGHNWGAGHCNGNPDCDLMCGSIGACSGGCVDFDAISLDIVLEERDSATCLSDSVAPQVAPFCETFDGLVSAQKWNFNGGGSIIANASTAPSPPRALRLDTSTLCSNISPDEIRSNRIQLGGLPSATLSYYTKFAGNASADAGDLVVEYRTDAQSWTTLNTLAAGGTPPVNFDFWSHTLPLAALDDGFRLRFRLAAADTNAIWWIDDVTVGPVAPDAPTLYVNSSAPPGGTGASWANAFSDLQEALAAAECSLGLVEQVWVAAGTYKPDAADRFATFRVPAGVSLFGGFNGAETLLEQRDPGTNITVLSGEIGDPGTTTDNSYHVVTVIGPDSVVDGFTIAGGRGDGVSPNERAGGLYNLGLNTTLRNCLLTENRAGRGAALYSDVSGTMQVEDCTFLHNHALFGSGGAIALDFGAAAQFDRTRFLGNTANNNGGALDVSNSSFTARNCLFSGNSADYGGAIYALGSGGLIVNSTLANNVALNHAGGVYVVFGEVQVDSSILWQNQHPGGFPEAAQLDGETVYANYSIVHNWSGALGGTGNSSSDPQFVAATGADLVAGTLDDDVRIAPTSPSINAGNPSVLPDVGDLDLAGRMRVTCARVDIGALESELGDGNADGAIDQSDALVLPDCLAGPGEVAAGGCEMFDFDADADVDAYDAALFLTCPFQSP